MVDDKNDMIIKDSVPEKKDLRSFLIDILTEMETLKNFIHQGQDIPAYRNLQMISDKIKAKIREG